MNDYALLKDVWLHLVKIGANSPEHEMYRAIYLPLAEWLDNNKHKEGEDEMDA
tara:strand:+ start:314 stop:472 length:159 start_codon:yes stop_codon:yes gene_type:complete